METEAAAAAAAPPAAAPAAARPAGAPGGGGGGAIGASALAAVLGNIMSGAAGPSMSALLQQRRAAADPGPTLGDVLRPELLAPLVREPDMVQRLAPYLPEQYRCAEGRGRGGMFRHAASSVARAPCRLSSAALRCYHQGSIGLENSPRPGTARGSAAMLGKPRGCCPTQGPVQTLLRAACLPA